VLLRRLWLTDFRSYEDADVTFAEGLTAVTGRNGQGKTNLLEAIGWLATLTSFRGAPVEAVVRHGADRAVVRADATRDDRSLLIEAEIVPGGRGRVQVNRQRLARGRDLLGALRVTVFSPDDLGLVKDGPSERRRYLDDTLVAIRPGRDALRTEVDRVLRQRNALLRQAAGRLDESAAFTLDVWDAKLAEIGTALAEARAELVGALAPRVADAYGRLTESERGRGPVVVSYLPSWAPLSLADALVRSRADDVRRGVSSVGPQRDELTVELAALPARTHASQGEQRSIAFALRIAAHQLVTATTGAPPVLLLDDVFSELDPGRADALFANLPPGQTVLTSAGGLPAGAVPARVLRVEGSTIEEL
jgi:DNA replication and repair protein RecF